ncbi:MAG TPA: hypothetical protein VFG10_05825 [Saprospiraceae bacterium]|nr:hypothetical protein [Saprospiraceae bacterium]
MSTGCKIENPSGTYFLTFQVIDWVDIFTRKIYRDIVLGSLEYCRKEKGLYVWGFVLMSNHMHAILSAKNGNLPDVIRDFKRFTATKIIKAISSEIESRKDWMLKRFEFASQKNVRSSDHQFWTHENHPVEIISHDFLMQKLMYIHLNPVRAGLVEKPEEWLYSSARNYSDRTALIEIDFYDGR